MAHLKHKHLKHSKRPAAEQPTQVPKPETETDGKLKPWEAEAIMSADLPSGDPELSPPAASGDQSPDRKKAA
ncbi:MAG: hypothetical protein ACJ763_02040 [Bdellovibrionia bacterium]